MQQVTLQLYGAGSLQQLGLVGPAPSQVAALTDDEPSTHIRASLVTGGTSLFTLNPADIPDDIYIVTAVTLEVTEIRVFTGEFPTSYVVWVNGAELSSYGVNEGSLGLITIDRELLRGLFTISAADLPTMEVGFQGGGYPPGDRWLIEKCLGVTLSYTSIYEHMAGTYSEPTRPVTEAEGLAVAEINDRILYAFGDYALAIRAASPDTKIYAYSIQRLLQPVTAAEWDAFAGAGAEAGYIHHAGVRRIKQPEGWYVMNMGHAPYIAWQIDRAIKALEGTLFGLPGQHPGLVLDGVLIDLTLWYPAFDSGANERVLTSDEYMAGDPDTYQTHCRDAFVATVEAVAAVYPNSVVLPNFGDLLFAQLTDANTKGVIASTSVIEVQAAILYTNGEPNISAESCVDRWTCLAGALGGKDVLAHGILISPQTQFHRDRSKIGVCAFFMMPACDGLYTRYASILESAAEITTWEQPDLLRAAKNLLGNASGIYTVVAGSWTKGTLYKRQFTNGAAYLFVRKSGQTGTETATFTIPFGTPLLPSGIPGAGVGSLALTLGEGAIVLDSLAGEAASCDTASMGQEPDVFSPGQSSEMESRGQSRHVFAIPRAE